MPALPSTDPVTVPAAAAPAPADSRYSHLDALRGIAVLSVALFHFSSELPPTAFTGLFAKGWSGVSVFFVISGFILPCALQSRGAYRFPQHYPLFLWKRILRLHPPYLAAVAGILAVWYVSVRWCGGHDWLPGFGWRDALAHPLVLNDILGLRWASEVFWTLAIEFQFYLLIAAVFPLLMRRGWWLGVTGVSLAAGLPDTPDEWILRYLPVFALGILAWKALCSSAAPAVLAAASALATLAAAHSVGGWSAGVSLVTALAVVYWRRGVPRWLIAAGTISYSLYLLHASVGNRLLQWLKTSLPHDSVPAQAAAMAAALAVSVAAAWMLYRLVERPAMRWSSARKFVR